MKWGGRRDGGWFVGINLAGVVTAVFAGDIWGPMHVGLHEVLAVGG